LWTHEPNGRQPDLQALRKVIAKLIVKVPVGYGD
jgi:hypothetical protein